MIQPRRVSFSRGFSWISEGFQLVFQSPFGWMKAISLWFAFTVLCGLMLVIGPVLFSLLLPIFFAGLMTGCRAIETGRSMQARHLFAGFQNKPGRLITLGGVNVLGEFLLSLLLLIWGGQRMTELQNLSMDGTGNLEQLQSLVMDLTPMFIAVSLLQVLLLMMGWFAPALLIFTPMTTGKALSLSGKACALNTLPFLAYSLGMGAVLLVILFTAMVVPLLGIVLFMIAIPTIIAAVYASYRDIFHDVLDLDDQRWTRVD